MTSFPFLKIARDHGVDYGEVIRLAQAIDDYGPDKSWEKHPLMRPVRSAFLEECRRREREDGDA